ncbi:class I SAM-dependent DNA methyltransferase [Cellulomonas fengjieae]|uniref:Class I SAM-dependent methyltransferase n=1 Tax=Cellulomonas fengjieae TaxID=2819978 RepID=A0ABS3SKY1_9CELL|nr:class I SAM-dependent methyltransferase [Cellulomonas fengjieae]MBO3086029.1 class I SAM-dependent methyltransferase [Cellulomonas fengjieae]MBO3103979.1 class I SAM-dependent methyltransferase [Cellulomonas fengjieae]QVI65902.1 class I SAM-dependent methyltransferase [Cellulomonas fengjieae]
MTLDATRATYDTVAVDYARVVTGLDAEGPLDRAMLADFADRVDGPVADVGCGTGRLTAYLAGLGIDVVGIDLSPGMIEVARGAHPGLRFEVGSMTALDLPDESQAGVLAWYSIIHTPPHGLRAVVAELRRVLAPGGHLLLGFQAGHDEHRAMTRAYGHEVSCDAWLHAPDTVAALLEAAGFVIDARLVREPAAGERRPQASLLASRRQPEDLVLPGATKSSR